MKLIMAISKDGCVSRGEDDKMTWTGPDDKTAFKLLTMVGQAAPFAAGRKTFDLLPTLKGRSVVALSREPGRGCTLESFDQQYPDGWLIGGQDVALEAIGMGLIDEMFLCHSPNAVFKGVKADFRLVNYGGVVNEIRVGRCTVEVRR